MIEAILNEQNLRLIIVDMGTSGEEGKRHLEYFQQQKLPQLRKFLVVQLNTSFNFEDASGAHLCYSSLL